MCKCSIMLKQVTPMIHFQAEQEGATIRATELKPKLDRFIVKLGKMDISKLKEAGFGDCANMIVKIGQDKNLCLPSVQGNKAFRYKVRVRPQDMSMAEKMPVRDPENNKKGYGAFFPVNDDTKDSSFYNKVMIEFLCFEKDLLKVIQKVFPMFIATTNFGFRQKKGFGHFSTVNELNNQEELVEKYCKLFSLEWNKSPYKHINYQGILGKICSLMKKKKHDSLQKIEQYFIPIVDDPNRNIFSKVMTIKYKL